MARESARLELREIIDSGVRAEEVACDLGFSLSAVHAWMAGRRNPPSLVKKAIVRMLGRIQKKQETVDKAE